MNNKTTQGKRTGFKKRLPLRAKITVMSLIISLTCAFIMAGFGYLLYRDSVTGYYVSKAANTAISFAAAIDPDLFLISNYAAEEDEYWHKLKAQLDNIKAQVENLAYFYIITLTNTNQIRYFAEAVRPGENPNDFQYFGAIARPGVYGREVIESFQTGQVATFDSYYSPGYGYLVAGLAPVFDHQSRVIAMVGADFHIGVVHAAARQFALYIVLFITLIALIATLAIRQVVSHMLSLTLRRILEADHTFADGAAFAVRERDRNSKEDISVLYLNFGEMFNSFYMLLTDIRNMSKSHIQGKHDILLDESKYKGGHLEVVRDVNQMTKLYINDFNELLKVVQSYGNGDFSVNVSKYPGDWVWANQAVDDLRASFVHVISEMSRLAENAAQGKFDDIADIGTQQGKWAELINKLNELLRSVEGPLAEIEHNVILMSKGDFSPLEADLKGNFDNVKQACNATNDITQAYVDEISKVLGAIAQGDLTVSLEHEYIGSYAPIKQGLNTILESLNSTMQEISSSAKQVTQSASLLSGSAEELSQGSYAQAATVEKLNSTIMLIEESTNYSSDRANDADNLIREITSKSSEQAKSGNEDMKSIGTFMEEIRASSANISKIIMVIEDIAFQTNLLALNASVEAARAGMHGAGFSVVAGEVRSLANRSSDAAKDTTSLIEESIDRVDKGSAAVQSIAKSLEVVMDGISNVSELVSQIAAISAKQAKKISDISLGINEFSHGVQSNAQTNEECASMAKEFSAQADTLMKLVAFYRLKER